MSIVHHESQIFRMIRRKFSIRPLLLGLIAMSVFGIILLISHLAAVCRDDNDTRTKTDYHQTSRSADFAGHLPAYCEVTADDLEECKVVRIVLERDDKDAVAAVQLLASVGVVREEPKELSYAYDSQRKILTIKDASDQPMRSLDRIVSRSKVNGKSFAFTYHFPLQEGHLVIPVFANVFGRSVRMTRVGERTNQNSEISSLNPLGQFGGVKEGCRARVYVLVNSRSLWSVEIAGDWTPFRDSDLQMIQMAESFLLFDVFSGTRL